MNPSIELACLLLAAPPPVAAAPETVAVPDSVQIANVLASYSLGEADLLRRAMGKKIEEEMARQRVRFLQGAKDNELDVVAAGAMFDILEKFAAYGFNRSHSAAYGLIAYQTASAASGSEAADDSRELATAVNDTRRRADTRRPVRTASGRRGSSPTRWTSTGSSSQSSTERPGAG